MSRRDCSRVLIVDQFFANAHRLRQSFEEVFADPRGVDSRRFCWDFWNVPGQYRLLRTPAYHFFPQALYEQFHRELVLWGRRNLGCHDISPPWLSCYVDGCEQNLHGDLPHGPWSFVFSLTPRKARRFKGGETLLLREEALDFWRVADLSRGMEQEDLMEAIEPRENRLVVFDPRIPHGVRRVEGASDVLDGRLVIHGWFVNPRPFIEGPLREKDLGSVIHRVLQVVDRFFQETQLEADGMLSYRLSVGKNGKLTQLRFLTHSLRARGGMTSGSFSPLFKEIERTLRLAAFPKKGSASQVTLPLVFTSRPPTT